MTSGEKLASGRVKFKNPPVVEVTCGVLFNSAQPIHGAHIGLFWERLKKEFPRIEETPPLPAIVEVPTARGGIPQMSIAFGVGTLPPLRRTLLVSEDGQSLIQIQADRLLFNWRRKEQPYQSYEIVVEKFENYLSKFINFLKEEQIGDIAFQQFELSYINHLVVGATCQKTAITEETVLVDHVRNESCKRFLPQPEAVNWMSIYPLPDSAGRLYTSAQSVSAPDGSRLMRLDLTARGFLSSQQKPRAWFDLAHEWITHGFADMTDEEVQKHIWERVS